MSTKKSTKTETSKVNNPKPEIIQSKGHEHQQNVISNVKEDFPIIGIGASAGGLGAFEAFFSGMPKDRDPNMAFVLVQHLAPDHKSMLKELIQRYTQMQVLEVADGIIVQPNCTYVIPPGHDMAFKNGSLQLLEPAMPRGQRLPIDFFFRSLAEGLHEKAIGVILSGTGSDGALGIRAIKGEGGMVMVQTPDSTEYEGMPVSAISTGLVDYTLPPDQMAKQLVSYIDHAFGKLNKANTSIVPVNESALKKIFMLIRSQTGNDFSHYKPSTINRRIERRMAVHQIDSISAYLKFMQQTPTEVEALFRDLLIGVTSFFRDTEAFKALEEVVIPRLFEGKPAGSQIRIWVAGCSTGEEAYSIAILVQEALDILKRSYHVQIFATDMDSRAITAARSGTYLASIASDVSPERLARFFTSENGGSSYRVHKNLRDLLIFSEQNVIKDPPFSKLDLITCRNMMIYMDSELQKKIIPLFHYALNKEGILFLGTSETVGEYHALFPAIDRKSKIFHRKEAFHSQKRDGFSQIIPPFPTAKVTPPKKVVKYVASPQVMLRDLTEQTLLEQVSLVAVLVTAEGHILYVHGQTGKYFELPIGTFENLNILAMAREGLSRELTIALHKAKSKKMIVTCPGLAVKTQGYTTVVNLTIRPVETHQSTDHESALYLIILEESSNVNTEEAKSNALQTLAFMSSTEPEGDPRINALKQELLAKEEYLQTTNEELETSNEELKSSNEEMQSVNEELQSTNEELETSKEELQSVNEELATVNSELQNKVIDLSQANNDMNNLLAGTGIATIFVNHQLCILRFTPAATQIINLIQTDIGRPVGHVVTNLIDYHRLVQDLQSVLDTLMPIEVEVQTHENRWYSLRINPYRTLENVIEGVVITFVEVTEIVKVRMLLKAANEQLSLAMVVRDSRDAITVQNLDGHIIAWNQAAERIYGWTEAEALQMNVRERIPKNHKVEEIEVLHKLAMAEVLEPYHTQRLTKDGVSLDIWMTATALVDETAKFYGITTTERIMDSKDL
jgi:two-component system CheB/CheR fusion protein